MKLINTVIWRSNHNPPPPFSCTWNTASKVLQTGLDPRWHPHNRCRLSYCMFRRCQSHMHDRLSHHSVRSIQPLHNADRMASHSVDKVQHCHNPYRTTARTGSTGDLQNNGSTLPPSTPNMSSLRSSHYMALHRRTQSLADKRSDMAPCDLKSWSGFRLANVESMCQTVWG